AQSVNKSISVNACNQRFNDAFGNIFHIFTTGYNRKNGKYIINQYVILIACLFLSDCSYLSYLCCLYNYSGIRLSISRHMSSVPG
ncbi:hypothetical protein WUBG_06575, partial [Wuchereria bancrofti]